MRESVHRLACATAISVVVTAYPSAANAQGADTAAAEALFQSGKSLLEQKNYAQACPKLAESYRLDPGTGTLLALALCHEGQGRIASAWGEFADVAARSRREGRPEREELARQHESALQSRLPMLTISVAPGAEKIDGLEIKRDGIIVGPGSWATPVPVDPGDHHIEATAPGRKPFSAAVTLRADAAREAVVVPGLEPAAEPPLPSVSEGAGHFWGPLRYAGVVVGGAGVAGVAVGAIFGLRAISLNNESKADCDSHSVCGRTGFSTRLDAQSAGKVSTVAFVAGGVLLAAGATMFVLAKPSPTGGMALRAAPLLSPGALGLGVDGAF